MPEENKNFPIHSGKRNVDVLQHYGEELERLDAAVELNNEQWKDQIELNEKDKNWKAKYEEELRLLREAYRNDRSMVIVFWQVLRFLGKVAFGLAAAGIGWAWNHPDKWESLFPKSGDK